jgi:hypothetical protein
LEVRVLAATVRVSRRFAESAGGRKSSLAALPERKIRDKNDETEKVGRAVRCNGVAEVLFWSLLQAAMCSA